MGCSALRRGLTGWKGASRSVAWVLSLSMFKVGLWMSEQVFWLYEFVIELGDPVEGLSNPLPVMGVGIGGSS